ncbi:hypothetical protein LQW54_008169 [Pestalotiopsis sp. IQ-011]
MAFVIPEKYQVLRCAQQETAIEDEPDVTAWVKRTTINPTHPFAIWSSDDTSELTALYPDLPSEVTNGYRNCGIAIGRAMISNSIEITTAGGKELTQYLYRATHDGQPYMGLKSRGQNGAPGQYFAIQLFMHLNWNARVESPFMSCADSERFAWFVAAMYEAREYKNIKVHKIDTRAGGWDRERQRIWSLGSLVKELKFQRHPGRNRMSHEHFIENCIPGEAITSSDWEQVQNRIDPYFLRFIRSRAQPKKKEAKEEEEEDEMEEEEEEDEDEDEGGLEEEEDDDEEPKKESALKKKVESIKITAEEKGVSQGIAARMVGQSTSQVRRRMKNHKRLLQKAN